MTSFVLAVLAGGFGIGLLLVAAGCMGRTVLDLDRFTNGRFAASFDRLLLRDSLGVAAAATGLWLSRWPVFGLVAFAAAWWAPTWWRTRGGYGRELALVEAIAAWTEQVRDTLAAANGLEHALGATAPLAPAPIAAAVGRLAARVDYEGLSDALRRFADEVDHPKADFVVAALVIAAEKQARELGALLGHLAESARDEARMRTRVWVGRARSRSAVRIIVGVVASFVVGLLLFNREYLRPYDSGGGQVALSAIIGVFIASFVLMERIGRIAMPQRFIARRIAVVHR